MYIIQQDNERKKIIEAVGLIPDFIFTLLLFNLENTYALFLVDFIYLIDFFCLIIFWFFCCCFLTLFIYVINIRIILTKGVKEAFEDTKRAIRIRKSKKETTQWPNNSMARLSR